EVERGAALHRDRRARVVRQHEHRVVIRRGVSPPASPGVVLPRAADRAEHVTAHDGCADANVTAAHELVVHTAARGAIVIPQHLATGWRLEYPFMQSRAAQPEWVVQALIWPGRVPIERN